VIRAFGERALLVNVVGWEMAQGLAASLGTHPLPGVEAAIPGLRSVLVELDAEGTGRAAEIVAALRRRLEAPLEPPSGQLRTVPVAYGGDGGPDLVEVAAICGMTGEEYAFRHAATTFRVMLCGFAPGFAYLGELPAELHVARLSTPRTRTPAGSVAVAGAMTGIYPADLPGGWRVIGRTSVPLFDPHRRSPALLGPGDAVRFRPIVP
jgi:KipI family sensor histidine kinase inhibitor